MCGIVGISNLNKNNNKIEKSTLINMSRMIRHRGPDEDGCYVNRQQTIGLGHVRLSIIDIQNGRQPMLSTCRGLVISFNGEIYDYKNLRTRLIEKGHIFQTHTDTEVILNLYKEYGNGFVNHLKGEFAFALYDLNKEKLIIVRDHFGMKPLYYTTQNQCLRFASEIKGIFGDKSVKRRLNHRTIFEQMMRADSSARTTFEDIHILPPGHMLIVENNDIKITKYWDLNFPKDGEHFSGFSQSYYAEALQDLLTKAVTTRMVSDVEVGCFLSGGLDSSILATIMQENSNKPIKTFSIGFDDPKYDESKYAKMVANHIGTDHHTLRLSHLDLAKAFPAANFHCEHLVQQIDGAGKYLLSKYAKDYVKVVQVGEGADEITLGYPWFQTAKLMNYWHEDRAEDLKNTITRNETARKGLDLTIAQALNSKDIIKEYGYYPMSINSIAEMEKFSIPLFTKDYLSSIKGVNARDVFKEDIDFSQLEGRNIINQNQYEFFKKTFHMYLMQYLGGKNEMANSIEGRLPFLDIDFFNFAKNIPVEHHLFGIREKHLLKVAFQQKLPSQIINRRKHGYSAPILASFLGKDAPSYFNYFLSEERLKQTGIFDFKAVHALLKRTTEMGYHEQMRTLYERSIIFVLSVQLMNDLFIENLPSNGETPIYS